MRKLVIASAAFFLASALAQPPAPPPKIKLKVGSEESSIRTLELAPGTYVSLGLSCSGSTCAVTINGSASAIPGTVDFSGADHTIVAKTGTIPPSSCTVGEWFFDTDAAAGNNILLCTAANTWTAVSGSGGGGGFAASWVAAQCHGSMAGTSFAFDASAAPGAVCIGGTNINRGVLRFYELSTTAAWQTVVLPSSYSTASVHGHWETAATSGNVVWQVQTACASAGSSSDPAWNTAQTATVAAPSTPRQRSSFTISPLTLTGCGANSTLHIRVLRDPAHASDNLGADADLLALRVEVQ